MESKTAREWLAPLGVECLAAGSGHLLDMICGAPRLAAMRGGDLAWHVGTDEAILSMSCHAIDSDGRHFKVRSVLVIVRVVNDAGQASLHLVLSS